MTPASSVVTWVHKIGINKDIASHNYLPAFVSGHLQGLGYYLLPCMSFFTF